MLGAGVLGLLTSLLLQRSGWRPLLAEPLAWRRAVAGSLGATAAAPEELAEERVPLVIDASGNPDAPAMALTMLAHEGTLLIASWFGTKPVVLPLGAITAATIHVTTVAARHRRTTPRASRGGRFRLPDQGRRDPVHLRAVPGARVRRGSSPAAPRLSPEVDAGPCSISRFPATHPAG